MNTTTFYFAMFLVFCIALLLAGATSAQEFLCEQPLDRGHTCENEKPEVKVYFDSETSQCLRFLYLGCGGNDNRFDDEGECGRCRMLDGSPCSGTSGPDCTMQPTRENETPVEPKCPDGFSCFMGFGSSTCCNDQEQEDYENAYTPKCPNGKEPTPRSKMDDSPIFGKTCNDKFCPDGSTCQDAKIWAFCCPE